MKRYLAITYATLFLLSAFSNSLIAAGKSQAGLTLLEPAGARPAALSEAFSSVANDIQAFPYNPASLSTLKDANASFFFERGLMDDFYGEFLLGLPGRDQGNGLSVRYYDGGTVNVFDGITHRSIKAQQDLTVMLGHAQNFGPVSLGVTGKYLSSTIGEQSRGKAFIGDLGFSLPMTEGIRLGGSVQNLGTKLNYGTAEDSLPTLARIGTSSQFRLGSVPAGLFLDLSYGINQKYLQPAAGIEINFNPIILRCGYKTGNNLQVFTAGIGFGWGGSSLDYAMGIVDKLNQNQWMSYSQRFQLESQKPMLVKKITPPSRAITQVKFDKDIPDINARYQSDFSSKLTYIVRPGDTLKSIARRYYGNETLWQRIYFANISTLKSPDEMPVGQKIFIPKRID